MNTLVRVRAVAPSGEKAREALAAAWKEMELGISKLDWHREDSDVSRINRDAGKWAVEVDPMVTSCLAAAREVNKLSDGAFDPTVLPILDVWRQAAKRNQMPTPEELAKARELAGMDKVTIIAAMGLRPVSELPAVPPGAPAPTPDELAKPVHVVQLDKKGMRLDLGGIAKGYIVGRMVGRMQQLGIQAALVEAGGDIYAVGERPRGLVTRGGDPRWGIGVQDPRHSDDPTCLYTALRIRDQAVVTSGHYRRGYTVEGKRFSHIVDPRTGEPVDTRLASVTVVARDPAIADGLATAIAVLGVAKGMALVEGLDDTECLLLEEAPPGPGPSAEAGPAEVRLIAHRSKGFAAMEYKPD
jgi:thiamine biosynthesis lipoprotein